MQLMTKISFLGVIQSPMWGLSPEQISKIEGIVDGSVSSTEPQVLTYEEAANRIGLKAKNRAKTIALWVRKGVLQAVKPQGKRAIGVTLESVDRLAASKNLVNQ